MPNDDDGDADVISNALINNDYLWDSGQNSESTIEIGDSDFL